MTNPAAEKARAKLLVDTVHDARLAAEAGNWKKVHRLIATATDFFFGRSLAILAERFDQMNKIKLTTAQVHQLDAIVIATRKKVGDPELVNIEQNTDDVVVTFAVNDVPYHHIIDVKGRIHHSTEPLTIEELHELGACGGDCPDCQRERAELRELREQSEPYDANELP